MKQLVLATLLTTLLAGCADTPTQQASIEDRAVATDSAKAGGTQQTADGKTVAAQSAVTDASQISGNAGDKPADGVAADPGSGKVQTQGVVAPVAEVKSLDGSVPGTASMAGTTDAQSGTAGSSASPLLDPKNPASPLAQRRILFDYDSAAIRDEYRGLLEAHAQYLQTDKVAKAILQGHADERGSREYNVALGQRRAESVYKALSLLGVSEDRIEAVSLGEEKPVAEGHDEEAWRQNRRVEILYQGE